MDAGNLAGLLGCGFGILFLLMMLAVGLAIGVFICYQLYLSAKALPAANQKLAPATVFLLLVPLVNLVWLFFVVLKMTEGYKGYFVANPRGDVGDCGYGVGLGWAIATACLIVPLANRFAGIASLILMVLYLVKLSQLRALVTPSPSA
jgi:hypothetical protein